MKYDLRRFGDQLLMIKMLMDNVIRLKWFLLEWQVSHCDIRKNIIGLRKIFSFIYHRHVLTRFFSCQYGNGSWGWAFDRIEFVFLPWFTRVLRVCVRVSFAVGWPRMAAVLALPPSCLPNRQWSQQTGGWLSITTHSCRAPTSLCIYSLWKKKKNQSRERHFHKGFTDTQIF